jgi:hypothetical protein
MSPFSRFVFLFPPSLQVGTVAAPCGSPAVPHLHRYYGFVRSLGILPRSLRFPAAARTLDLAEAVLPVGGG